LSLTMRASSGKWYPYHSLHPTREGGRMKERKIKKRRGGELDGVLGAEGSCGIIKGGRGLRMKER
jgi:hypothetical protein